MGADYFQFFGIPRQLSLEAKRLEKIYYELSKKFHPDFHQQKGEGEKRESLEKASALNAAYRVLKEPVARAEYLLQLEGFPPMKENKQVSPALMMEMFELQEEMESLRRKKDEAGKGRLSEVLAELRGKKERLEKQLLDFFQAWDAAAAGAPSTKKELGEKMTAVLMERSYVRKIAEQIETELEGW